MLYFIALGALVVAMLLSNAGDRAGAAASAFDKASFHNIDSIVHAIKARLRAGLLNDLSGLSFLASIVVFIVAVVRSLA